ncbi:PLP-dependent aminotransferase family protein [Streptomyces sp. NPDC056231]|uniref:aminotransferase-like domain-containing protein n=1 Tax=Streptomyces sp. NPDC056231 TaxID=3345755 RepID=UPI003AAC6D6D
MSATHLPLARRAPNLVGSVIDSSTSLLASQTHDIVRFAMGAPSDDLMPVGVFNQYYGGSTPGKYTYGATDGEPELVEQVLALTQLQGIETSADRITITTGGMQGLDLACKLFVDPGDLVVVEGPTYTNGIATALSYGAEVLDAPLDENGLVVEELPELIARAGRTPKAIYTIPTFQNPSGATLSRARREQLLELAERWGSVIIDDDPYGLLRFEGGPVPSFTQIAPGHPLVFSVRTFSKILAPGLRVGWVDAPTELRQLLINAKQAMDTCTNVPAQHLVANFLKDGHLDTHLRWVKGLYQERKNAMRDSLRTHFGNSVRSTNPEGGFFLWLAFAGAYADIHTQKLFKPALHHDVAYIPGPAFSTTGAFSDALRLCFATSSPERINEGVVRLKRAADEMLEGIA